MHDVVVVGGGIAGLAAAWALRDRDVVVLEASDRVGGRMRSERRGPYWLNFGAHVFGGAGTATDRLLGETGVEAVEIPGVLTALSFEGRLAAHGRVETYPFRLPLTAGDRLAFVRAGARLRLAVARYARVARYGDQERMLRFLGDRTFAEWLGPVPPAVDAILRPTLQRSAGEPEELAAGYGIGYFHLVWDRSGGLARGILGGSATLPEAIAAKLGERVRLEANVEEVVAEGDCVRVAYEGGELRARFAVVATPAPTTLRLIPTLPEDVRGALSEVVYGPYVVAAFLTNESGPTSWDGIYAIATASRSFNMLFNMASVLRTGKREPGGSLMVYSGASLARALWNEDDATIVDTYLRDLDDVLPGTADVVAETVVHRWERGLAYVRPGRYRIQRTLGRPLGNIVLAGDYFGTRYTDTAIATGFAAAAKIENRFSTVTPRPPPGPAAS